MQEVIDRFLTEIRQILRREIVAELSKTLVANGHSPQRRNTSRPFDDQALLALLPARRKTLVNSLKEPENRVRYALARLQQDGLVRAQGRTAGAIWVRAA